MNKINFKDLKFSITVIVFSFVMGHSQNIFCQVKIGENNKTINADAMLEVESVNKGILLPRIALTSTSNASPLKVFTSGMIVYNTSTSNDLTPGLYYSDGTKWIKANNNAYTGGNFYNIQTYIDTVVINNQKIFKTPSVITDINKIFLYRNGVLISCTINNTNSIVSELPCKQGDQIRIIQLL